MSYRRGEKRRKWGQDDMDKALEDIRLNGMRPSAASKKYDIPRKTITDRLEKKVADDCRGSGPGTHLSKDHEAALVSYIEYMAQRAFPLTITQIMMYAWVIDRTEGGNKFGPNGPCYTWWLGFKARHGDKIKLRKPDSLDRGRALFSTVNNLRSYYQLLKGVLEEGEFSNRPQDIYNCDETIVDLNKNSQKVIVPRRFRASHSRQVASSEHITIHCCISAAGNSIPPFIIFKTAFPGGNYTIGGPDGTIYGKQKSGFMDGELFVQWLTKLFIPHARPTEERSILLLVDGHSSHCTPEVVKIARENNVILLALPPHTTHLCQPLDVAVYKALKVQIGKHVKMGQALRGDLWISKTQVPKMLKEPYEAAMTMQNIKAGFKKCGVFPFNPNAIDRSQLSRNKLIPNEDIDLSLPPDEETVEEDQAQTINEDVPPEEAAPINTTSTIADLQTISTVQPQTNTISNEDTTQFRMSPSINDNTDINHNVSNIELQDFEIISEEEFNLMKATELNTIIDHDTSLPDLGSISSFLDQENNENNEPFKLKMFSKNFPTVNSFAPTDSIFVVPTQKDASTQTDPPAQKSEKESYRQNPTLNPLVTTGIIPRELAEIFTPPDEKIPVGRKRPLRTKSKARVMTSDEVMEDIRLQEEAIENEGARKQQRITRLANKKRKTGGAKSTSGTRNDTGVPTSTPSSPVPSTSGTRRCSSRKSKAKKRVSTESFEDNNCYKCSKKFEDDTRENQCKWVGCEEKGCPRWVCVGCLPQQFSYSDEYFCSECIL